MVSREVARNSYATAGCQAVHADCQAERNRARPQGLKIVKDPALHDRVLADLKLGRPPRAIAVRRAAEGDHGLQPVSTAKLRSPLVAR